jgi:hypothetical protein
MEKLMRFVPIIIPLYLITLIPCSAAITVTENNENKYSFIWESKEYSVDPIQQGGSSLTRIQSGAANIDLGEAGEPAIPGYSFHVGIGPLGRGSISFVPLEVKTIHLDYPLAKRDGTPGLAQQPHIQFADPWISSGSLTRLGQLRAEQYVLRLFLYDEKTMTLRILVRAACIIQLPPIVSPTQTLNTASEYNQIVRNLVLNYSTAQRWGIPRPSGKLARKSSVQFPFTAGTRFIKFSIGDGHDNFNEGTTIENGILQIPGQEILSNLGVSSVPINQIALFGSVKGELSMAMPDTAHFPEGFVQLPLLRIDENHDGNLGTSDKLLAYVTGNSDWAFDTIDSEFKFRLNRYDDYRHYWIAIQPLAAISMPQFNCTTTTVSQTRSSSPYYLCIKKSRIMPSDGREGTIDWIWEKLSAVNPQLSYSLDATYIDHDSTGFIQVTSGRIADYSHVDILVGGIAIDTPSFGASRWYTVPKESWNQPEIRITYNGAGGANHEIADIQVCYQQRLSMAGRNALMAYSPADKSLMRYQITDLPSDKNVYIMRIPVDETKISLIDTLPAGSASSYSWVDTAGIGIRYFVATSAGLINGLSYESGIIPPNNDTIISDLRNTSNRADFLIVYHPDFESEAKRLAAHKKSLGRFSNVRMVNIYSIYQQFSGGNVDPASLRNLLFYAYNFWGSAADANQLTYVIFLGSGNWDYKGILRRDPSKIPVIEVGESGSEECIEDYYTYLTPGEDAFNTFSSSIFLGRLPCSTPAQAQAIVSKIIESEDPSKADFTGWRNRFLMVADDEMQGPTKDGSNEYRPHYLSSETVANQITGQCPSIDLRKVYLYDYEVNELYEKPSAGRALINEINNGVSAVNYFGHGAYDVWADEHILTKDDLAGLTNRGKYPGIHSFSCSVGKFDDPEPDKTCLSALLVLLPNAGALSAISSTREAYANYNEALATSFYRILFDSTQCFSLGQAYLMAKKIGSSQNFRTYALLGDPSFRTLRPSRRVIMHIYDDNNKPLDTLPAQSRITVRGQVVDTATGLVDASFGSAGKPATILISLFNPRGSARHLSRVSSDTIRYWTPGTPLFLGQTSVVAGQFTQTILLPRNVDFGKPGAKLTAYAWQGEKSGLGSDTTYLFLGSRLDSTGDAAGPVISIKPEYDDAEYNTSVSFTDGITSTLPLKAKVLVYDENGIDVSGIGPDEGITIEIPGIISRRSINNTFQFDQGSFQQGGSPFVLETGQVQPGVYSLNVTAQDLLGNTSKKSFALTVLDENQLSLDHVFNFPNPMRMSGKTRFFFYHSNTATNYNRLSLDIIIRIFTMSGKLIKVIRQPRNGEEWDGTDQFGHILTPNIYLYQITLKNTNGIGSDIKSPIRKLVIYPPK